MEENAHLKDKIKLYRGAAARAELKRGVTNNFKSKLSKTSLMLNLNRCCTERSSSPIASQEPQSQTQINSTVELI